MDIRRDRPWPSLKFKNLTNLQIDLLNVLVAYQELPLRLR
jgi:hypothetical protein